MNPPRTIAEVLAETGPILLDFDGPVCAVFATLPAPTVAEQLRQVLTTHGAPIPEHITDEPDPLQILRYTATLNDHQLTAKVDDALRDAELSAVTGATPTPYAREVIVAAYHAGRPLAVVSNNSAPAIHAYLNRHRLSRYLHPIIGRTYADPDQMKPNPAPVQAAVDALGVNPAECVLIGDSPTDVQAARAAGTLTIGYANHPTKAHRLTEVGADAMAEHPDGLRDLALCLLAELELPDLAQLVRTVSAVDTERR